MNYLKQTVPIADGELSAPEGCTSLVFAARGEEGLSEHTIYVKVPVWHLIWAKPDIELV